MKITKAIYCLFLFRIILGHSSSAFHYDFNSIGVLVDQTRDFSYHELNERGPSKWGQLDPGWKACGQGKLQSPINLARHVPVLPSLGDLQKSYRPAPATIKSRGHDIMVTWKGDAGGVNIDGNFYALKHCHWHSAAEHHIHGHRHDLELHLVHLNSQGRIAVVAVLYRIGHPDPFLSSLSPSIKSVTKEDKDAGNVNPELVDFGSKKYYRYIGSLSTPPCTEGVTWTVFEEARMAAAEQIQALKDAADPEFRQNARPIQHAHGREVYLYSP